MLLIVMGFLPSCNFVFLKNIFAQNKLLSFYLQVVRERKILDVNIDKGMEDGQKISFSGEGDQEPGLEPGDLILVLDEKEHEVFR